MHSRKSIFYKGIIFILSFFAMAIFSYNSVKAAECSVSFQDNNQYLVIGGDNSKWNDSGALLVNGDGCNNIGVKSITVNGERAEGQKFSTASLSPGHYTVGYNYSYSKNDGGTITSESGTIYRYIRVLNSDFSTSNNYTLATFDQVGSVVASFDIGNNHFANFVVDNSKTYVVIKDVLGNNIVSSPINATGKDFVAKEVVKGPSYYYVIGNNDTKGVLAVYNISYSEGAYTISSVKGVENVSANYNDGYYNAGKIYLAGKTTQDGKPHIDIYDNNGNQEAISYTYTAEKGEFLGVSVSSEGYLYAVGYLKADNSNVQSDLFAYVNLSLNGSLTFVDVLKDQEGTISNTVFYDIVSNFKDTDSLVIVGETTLVDINANGNYASNKDSRYSDAFVLEVSSDGTVLRNVKMVGSVNNDAFTKIDKYGTDKYYVIGSQNNNNASLVYTLNSGFELEPHITNANSGYTVTGMMTWAHGAVYYGKINASTSKILNMHYIGANNTDVTPLFVSLDSRTFDDFATINLIHNNKYPICNYKVTYGTGKYNASSCDEQMAAPEDGSEDFYKYYINTSSLTPTLESKGRLNYQISTQTGATIFIYRMINVTSEPVATNLESNKSGILRWYVYNRLYTYTNDSTQRIVHDSFNYNSNESIESIIETYVLNGVSSKVTLRGTSNNPQTGELYSTFNKHYQDSAAFASIEYAKMFAYYLEFSRVVRVEGTTPEDVGAIRYSTPSSGNGIQTGAPFYIYYIDYRGSNLTSNLVADCYVTPNNVSNCSNKGGYAFATLNDLRLVIEYLLKYNDFFVSTRNTIYTGSIEPSKLDLYYQEMYTKEYLKSYKLDNEENLTINVEKDGEIIYKGKDTNVYFGGTLNGTTYSHPLLKQNLTVNKLDADHQYHVSEDGKYVVFASDGCYKVYFSFVNASGEDSSIGTPKEFCVDNTAPIIIYDKDSSAIDSTHNANSNTGISVEKPLFIESSFEIVGLDDLDEYAFIYVNGNRYPITCSNDSQSCLDDIKTHILKRFEYNKNKTREVLSITFQDRLLNTNTFYFVVGTKSPTIQVVDQTDDGFKLVIDFYDSNPIVTASVLVVPQSCSGEAGSKCYDPIKAEDDNPNQKPITESENLLAFNQALKDYILAVSYRDNELAKKEIIVVEAIEGVYTIDGVGYIIEDGHFVEYSGFGEPIEIDQYSMFSYDDEKYMYKEVENSIYTMTIDGEGTYIIDTTIEPIPLLNTEQYDNVFRFDMNGREYRISKEGNKYYVLPIANKYEIKNNEFKIGSIAYNYDSASNKVSYNNPEVGQLKHIELDFKRTIIEDKLIVEGTGVSIPKVEPVMDKGVHQVDPITNQLAYTILPEEYVHFDLIDGSYTFTITENFTPFTHQVKADINVEDLEVDLGVAKTDYPDPLALTDKTLYDFTLDSDNSNTIALRRLDGADNYPLNATVIQDSNLANYKNTYFVDRTFYMGVKFSSLSVLVLKVYNSLNEYGIPYDISCKALVIYGNGFENASPVNAEDVGCGASNVQLVRYDLLNNNILEEYGASRIVDDATSEEGINSGFFGFNKEFTFYEIKFSAYDKETHEEAVNPIVNYVYIDTVNPDDEENDTITTEIYHDNGSVLNEYIFVKDENGVNVLDKVIGDSSHLRFKLSYNTGSVTDKKENKLLLLTIVDGSEAPPICNVYELIRNGNKYETGCKNYVDLEKSAQNGDVVDLVFSATGAYTIVFTDASGNYTTYSFKIDKEAPIVSVVGAKDKIFNGETFEEIEISTSNIDDGKVTYVHEYYTKNPSIKIQLYDLIGVGSYCYKFASQVYSDSDYTCLSANDPQQEYTLNMSDTMIQALSEAAFNGDVVLYVYGVDTQGNSGNGNDISVHFWVDYEAASAKEIVKQNLNENIIDDARNLAFKTTIQVLSEDYKGYVACVYDDSVGKYLFAFIDAREEKEYTFAIECQDIHDNESKDVYSRGAYNNLYMKFYESSDGITKGEIFNFGMTNGSYYEGKEDGKARWIYITIVDNVGNESDKIIALPIFVEDATAPTIDNVSKQNEQGGFVTIEKADYEHSAIGIAGFDYDTFVYLANNSIRVKYSEPIYKVISCNYVSSIDDYTDIKECESYPAESEYQYADKKVEFEFTNDISETTKIYVMVVQDFATFQSVPVVVVIDRITPTITPTGNGADDVTIQYKIGIEKYDENYKRVTYDSDVTEDDDQAKASKVHVRYHIYEPKFSYNNYLKNGNEFTLISNDSPIERTTNKKFYVLIEKEAAIRNNKSCVATVIKSGVEYCYVPDTQSYYYYDSLLKEDDRYWREVSQIDNLTLGVYRISYYVVDFAGNQSKTIYKKIFVSDSLDPSIDLVKGDKTLYRNVSTSNDDGFQGKLNESLTFLGLDKDLLGNDSKGVSLILYKCHSDVYVQKKCDIQSQYLYNNLSTLGGITRHESTNEFNLGTSLTDGVYKMFVYDKGGYSKDKFGATNVYHDDDLIKEDVYSRDLNVTYFYFAVKIGETGANYVINGNLNTENRAPQSHGEEKVNVYYKYSNYNFYTISSNPSRDRDVYLVLDNKDGTYTDISANNPNAIIGNASFLPTKSGDNIIFTYYDNLGRVVYRVEYAPYAVSKGLFLNDTYHNVDYYDDGKTVTASARVCVSENGVNPCESLETVYTVVSVSANVYEDGVYTFRMMDRYGNLSPDIGKYMIDNTAYHENRNSNPATGVNYWFSVPSVPVSESNIAYFDELNKLESLENINLLDAKFSGNFNSSFFYAFASKTEAKEYLVKRYIEEINRVFSLSDEPVDSYSLKNTKGIELKLYRESQYGNGSEVASDTVFIQFISSLIYEVYVGDSSFEDEEINQVAYTGEEAKSSMFEYVWLKIIKTITNGRITTDYTLIKDGVCTIENTLTQECIKVNLKIVPSGTSIKVYEGTEDSVSDKLHRISCVMSGTGVDSNQGTGCNINQVASGVIYVFIDKDTETNELAERHHSNDVYFGVIAYSETSTVQYSELGSWVPLNKFEKYLNSEDLNSDDNGRYIFLNSEYILIDDIIKTSLYTKSCTFNHNEETEGCVYVTYLSGYTRVWNDKDKEFQYQPAHKVRPEYYLNYYDSNYYPKDQISSKLGVDLTFSSNGEIDSGGTFIPIKITPSPSITTDLTDQNSDVKTNKRVYLELFNNTTNSKLFEIKRLSSGEVYSYASLKINGTPININDKIIVNKDGTYRCIINIPREDSYYIEVTDRAGNKFSIIFSHSDTIPSLDFKLEDETMTDSNGEVIIKTESPVAAFSKDTVKIYMAEKKEKEVGGVKTYYYEYAAYTNALCVSYVQSDLSYVPVRTLNLVFKKVNGFNCGGAYRIEVADNHGNTNYIEFIFNPYNLATEYIVDTTYNKVHPYSEDYQVAPEVFETINGVIVSDGFSVEIDKDANYLVVNQYDPYSNLDLSKSISHATTTIKDFVDGSSTKIGNCNITIIVENDSPIASVYISGISCDGVYTIDIYNRFADDVLEYEFLSVLEGANTEQISSRVKYGEATTIEIDTTKPTVDNDAYFSLFVDEVKDSQGTQTLMTSANKTIEYTNRYITVTWGGLKSQGLTYLKYRVNPSSEDDDWHTVSENVKYDYDYTASVEFEFNAEGVYKCEFIFTDAVGNEDVSDRYTIIITIEPPRVNFYEIISGDSNNTLILGDAYQYATRIGDRTILKCEYKDGNVIKTKDCTLEGDGTYHYEYRMVVNGRYIREFADNLELKDIISHDSYWLMGYPVKDDLELDITLTVNVKGKDDIKTVLFIKIDKKAPEITLSGKTVGSTYTGGVTVNLSKEDSTNTGYVLRCDVIDEDERCLVYENNILIEKDDMSNLVANINKGAYSTSIGVDKSGYFLVVAYDDLGNSSKKWFVLDNDAPEIKVGAGNSIVAPGMYTNANSVLVEVMDELSSSKAKFTIEFTPFDEKDTEEVSYETYNSLVGLTKEGKYKLTPIDGVGISGRSISFYIYRHAPSYKITTNQDDDPHVVNTEATLSWEKSDNELVAPIVSVTINGKMYDAVYNSKDKTYTGTTIQDIGEHTFVVIDSAGNRSTTMVTINNSKKVCINGVSVDVKMQAYYNVDELLIGKEKGVEYKKDDVIIFALPSQGGGDCSEAGLLGYRTLDPLGSNYLINTDNIAKLFRENKYDFIANGFITQEAMEEVKAVGGTVVVFVVTKDIANRKLGYKVGTNFFLEDPIGWSMIFVVGLSMVWPAVRIFVKKKVRVI